MNSPDPSTESPDENWLPSFNLGDVVSAAQHSPDFGGSRAEFISKRVVALCLLIAALIVAWIPVDYLLADTETFAWLALSRIITALLLIAMVLRRQPMHRFSAAITKLSTLVVILVFFAVGSGLAAGTQDSTLLHQGYSFFPFLLIAMLAAFPLTLVEGLLLALPVALGSISLNALQGQLYTLTGLTDLWLLGLLLAVTLWTQMAQTQMLLRLYRQASRDPLTGLFNRRVLVNRLVDELDRSRRYQRSLTLLMMDLDRFKRVNDRHGHLAGDAVLRSFSKTVQAQLRNVDLAGRYGGEEFLAVLPETALEGAALVAERIRESCRRTPVETFAGETLSCTVSIGVAEVGANESLQAALDRVDKALYLAKHEGRDRVSLASPEAVTGLTGERPRVTG